MLTIQILGFAHGDASPFDGEYLVHYDPERDMTIPGWGTLTCYLITTPDRSKAKQYETISDAFKERNRISLREPFRPDLLPNRPLTMFHLAIDRK